MEQFNPALFLQISGIVGHYYKKFAEIIDSHAWSAKKIISAGDRSRFAELCDSIKDECKGLELDAALATLEKMKMCLKNSKSKYGDFFGLGPELGSVPR
jgi:hypothetical protein